MGPKIEKRGSTQQEALLSISDPINTEEWKCAVVLVLEADQRDVALTQRFTEEVARNARKEVKSIDFERDIMKILKNFISGEISVKYSFLLNFSAIFEEAGEYVKNMENIPVILIVKIIKAFIWMLKKEDESERKTRMLCHNNPIEIMAAKPLVPLYGNEGTEKNDDAKGKSDRRKSVKNVTTLVKIKPLTPAKEDTKLLRRGEMFTDFNSIDDVPDNSFFQLYIALTGFQNPELALEMLKDDIPLHGVICLRSSCPVKPIPPSLSANLDAFWNDFLQLLWNPSLTHYFKDVVFLVYNPQDLPTDEKELRSFIFREISFLMYDLSDLKYQLRHYHRHMRLWNVEEQTKIEFDRREMEQLPLHCSSIPLIMQNILDILCGEDDEEDDGVEPFDTSVSGNSWTTFSASTTRLEVTPESKSSFTSLLPLTSTLILPTPRWSTIIDTDEKLLLFNKMLALDQLYDLEENSDGSGVDTNSLNVCSIKKRRLFCQNLDLEIDSLEEGLVMKLWLNYPVQEKGDGIKLNELTAMLKYPELTLNYILYIIWIIRMEETTREIQDTVSISDSISDIFETRFTVTDGSRIALQKMNRPSNFFSPSHLKIITPEMMTSLSAPQFRTPPRFSWTEKSFVSDVHIPVKYLQGEPLGVFNDLRNHLGESAFSRMKDYEFIELLNKQDLIRRIQETAPNYDSIRHAYLPLTDCIYIVMYNNPTRNGVQRETYNVLLTTPVGLRDFYNYIIDDERDWLKKQNVGAAYGKTGESCADSMYNPTPDFRGFNEYDFWHEDSIKYATQEAKIVESIVQRSLASEPAVRRRTTEEKRASVQKSKLSVYAEPGESYRYVGFDFEPGAVQYSGVDTTFKGPDNCSVRASIQERLYGTQQLGVHVQQGGHTLHLYSFICPQPHLNQPYSCHVEYKNGTILAFSRRVFPNEDAPPESSTTAVIEDEKFAYNMKVSLPHGLTVTAVRKQVTPCYIKQSYRKNSSDVAAIENSRLFLPNGNIVTMLTDNTVQVFKSDTSVLTASLEDLALQSPQTESECSDVNAGESNVLVTNQLHFHSYVKTSPNGHQCTVVNNRVTERKQYQIVVKTEKETQDIYHRRMDGTCYVMMNDGSLCVEFIDGSKICTYLREDELYLEDELDWDGEDATGSVYSVVHMKIVMEHPDYATAIYDTRNGTWKINFPSRSEVEIDSQGCYQVHIDDQTELDIDTKAIRMWRYSPRDEFIISTVADLTAFEKDSSAKYCTTTDCHGRRFTIEATGACYVAENDVWNEYGSSSTLENQSEDITQHKRYFVVNRDMSGFEIIHTRNAIRDIESAEPDAIVHSQKLNTTPSTRYFAILKETRKESKKWTVESINPKTKFAVFKPTISSTYGKPPSWMHPFPRKKPKAPKPGVLHGRILLETTPTECPEPNNADAVQYDTSDFPETCSSLSDDVNDIMQRVANQDQEILSDIYYAAMRVKAEAKKVRFEGNQEVEKYLKKSEYHVAHRNHLKNCIREGKVPGYFEYPTGIAWHIIQTIVESVVTQEEEQQPEVDHIPNGSALSTESSEVEYNLEWSTEPSYSDLSHRSNISAKTAPEMTRPPVCKPLLPLPRDVKSEPIYKIEDLSIRDDNLSYVAGYSFTPPQFSQVCAFTREDILTLEKKSSVNDEEPEKPLYELEDLMNLGLV